jgi:putative sigma-54 modulation protein
MPGWEEVIVHVAIRARNVQVDQALKDLTREKISKLARFLAGMDHAEVCFSEERNPRIATNEVCEVTLTGHGHFVRAKSSAASAQAAMDLVVDKLEQQLGRLKGKLDGQKNGGPKRKSAGNGFKGAAKNGNGTAVLEMAPAPEAVSDTNEAMIVKTKQIVVTPMTPEDAALQMDLLQHDFFLFTNSETDRPAVIYRREDGHLGLIDAAA